MERSLTKRFEDERLKRLINSVTSIEDLRKLCLEIYDAKIKQEQVMMEMLFNWKVLTKTQVEGLMPKPKWDSGKEYRD